jgi:DNA-binding SARP family transcriptional activator
MLGSELVLRVLGPVEAWRDDAWLRPRTPQQRLVLGMLALRAGLVVPADELISTVWDGDPPRSVRNSVHVLLANLRKFVGQTPGVALTRCGDGYRLDADPDRVDAERFRRLAGMARKAGGGPSAVASFDQALGLWRGPALADVADTVRAGQIRSGLARERLSAMEDRLGALLDCGGHRGAAAELRRLLEDHPLSERLAEMLMLALYGGGSQADALEVFRDMRRRLVGELGVEPGAEIQRLHQRILARDPALCGKPEPISAKAASYAAAAEEPAEPAADESRETSGTAGPMSARAVVPRQLPAAIRHFTGRSAELAVLSGMLEEATAGAMVISAIGGTAGVGKTTLALHWAHQVADQFPDGQLYVNLRGCGPSTVPVSPADAVRGFLDALGLSAEQIPADPDAQIGLYRSVLAGRRMLILLDDARDERQVRPLLPGSPCTVAMVTSRNQLAGLAAAQGACLLTLDVLCQAEAGELLDRRLGAGRVSAEPQATAELTEACARLPLALSIAAARAAARPGFPLAALAAELRDVRGRLDALDAGDAASSVRAAFSWSYHQLGELAARMFRLLSVHPGPDVTAAAAASLAGVPQPQARAALGELGRASLLAEHAPGRYAFHDLMRAYAAERARAEDGEAERRAAALRALDHYLHSARAAALRLYPVTDAIALPRRRPAVAPEAFTDNKQAWDWFAAEHRVLMSVISMAVSAGFDTYAWQIPWALTEFLDR